MAQSDGILVPDWGVSVDASPGLVLKRVHKPDEVLRDALARSPRTSLLGHIALSSGDEAGTVYITVGATAESFIAVLTRSGSSGIRAANPAESPRSERRFNLDMDAHEGISIVVLESEDYPELALAVNTDILAEAEGGRGPISLTETILRTRAVSAAHADLGAIDSLLVTGPVTATGNAYAEALPEAPQAEATGGGLTELAQIGASTAPIVQLNAPVTVIVRLARGEVTVDWSQAYDEQIIVVEPDQPLNIPLFCRNFTVTENQPDNQGVLLPPPREEVVTFSLLATEVGPGDVQVVLRQTEPLPIATLWLNATVQLDHVTSDTEGADTGVTTFVPPVVHQFLAPKTLTIDENLVRGQSRLSFEPVLPGVRKKFEQVIPIKAEITGRLFSDIDAAWSEFKALPTRARTLAFRRKLQALGVRLAHDALPDELGSYFEAHPEQIDEVTILTSGETDIPWELVYIDDPIIDDDDNDETGFLGRAGLVRWIYTPHPRTLRVSAGRALYLCPRNVDKNLALVAAEQERDYLISDFAATEIVPGNADSIRSLLEGRAFDLLHFGGHGLTDEEADPPRQQLLWRTSWDLQRNCLTPIRLRTYDGICPTAPRLPFKTSAHSSCSTHAGSGDHPRSARNKGASQKHFSAEVPQLSSAVSGRSVTNWPETSYAPSTPASGQKTIAEATTDARREARKSGDTSWLAYTVYAHPDAHVEVTGIKSSITTSSAADSQRPSIIDPYRPSPKGSEMFTSEATRTIPRHSGLSGNQLQALHPHVVNMKDGELSKGPRVRPTSDHDFRTTQADLAEIFRTHLPSFIAAQSRPGPVPLVIYAHGGLVDKGPGLKIAQDQVEWWKKNGAYPIHLVWETGFAAALWDAVKDSLPGRPRNLGDFFDGIIETAVRSARGDLTWSAMKRDAEHASGSTGGGAALATLLSAYMRANPGQISVHLVGHSAGSIIHSHLVPALLTAGVPGITSLSLMAPAVRIDTFKTQILSRLDKIDALTIFTMSNEVEENDSCLGIYKKSLLYLIRGALEPEPAAKILGLQISLFADPELSDLFQPRSGSRVEVVWSKSDSGLRSSSQSSSHGGFDNDGPTMNSVARRVLDRDSIIPFPATRALYPLWPDEDDVFEYVEQTRNDEALSSSEMPGSPQRPPRRRALCIGIDSYPTDALFGCVSDAMAWQAAFAAAGFETETLLNEQATQERMLDKIRELVVSSRAGDVIALQYSGHGTTIEDLDQDEWLEDADDDGHDEEHIEDRDIEHKLVDEALCPVDFREGNLIIDDDLGAIWDLLPDNVNLTIIFDSCHSGGAQRDIATHSRSAPGSRKRLVRMDKHAIQKYKAIRGTPSRSTARDNERGVFFGACLATEPAYETGNQGDFTSRALPLFRQAIGSATNRAFHEMVLAAFGGNRRQTPVVKPPSLLERPLLAPLLIAPPADPGTGPKNEVVSTSRPPHTITPTEPVLDGDENRDRTAVVAAFLRATADLISPR